MCQNPIYNCQKQTTFTPKHFQLEGGSFKSKVQKFSEGHKLHGIIF